MIHCVYQTTNLTNGKKYIGKHSTKVYNNYLGSGTALLLAVEKYGSENFKKEILSIHDTSELAYEAEKLIIDQLEATKRNKRENV